MVNYKLAPTADEDLDEIFYYGMVHFGIEQAVKFLEGIKFRFQEIANHPYQYQAVDDISFGLRRSVYISHSIYYRVGKREITIIRILKHQDLVKAFLKDI